MICQNCTKLTKDFDADKPTCAACRKVLKIDLVRLVLELDPIYLTERTRNKTGRPRAISDPNDCHAIQQKYMAGASMGQLAKEYGVGRSTIHRVVHE
jgi:hypothetical protein